jgi:hypothetical protein
LYDSCTSYGRCTSYDRYRARRAAIDYGFILITDVNQALLLAESIERKVAPPHNVQRRTLVTQRATCACHAADSAAYTCHASDSAA